MIVAVLRIEGCRLLPELLVLPRPIVPSGSGRAARLGAAAFGHLTLLSCGWPDLEWSRFQAQIPPAFGLVQSVSLLLLLLFT